jgi:hypothetical protein
MLPRRRDRKTPYPPEEREIPRRRGRKMPDPTMEREMRDLRARLEEIEIAQRRIANVGDVNLKVKMKLDMKEEKLQQKMQQMNAYSGLLQEWVLGRKWIFQYMKET